MPKVTIKALHADLAAAKSAADSLAKRCNELSQQRDGWERQAKETREQFADLKKRLHTSEMEVARLNGYLARVREDDTVREDLVAVGEPDGQQRLVPKRKHEFLGNSEMTPTDFECLTDGYGRRKQPKHWIEY